MARERIIDFVERFDGSIANAIDHLNAGYRSKTLTGPLMWAMEHAWDKRRKDTRLVARTFQHWKSAKKKRGRAAPKKRQKDMEVKPWHPLAVKLKQRPQGSVMKWIAEQIAQNWKPEWGAKPPSYDVVCRFFSDKFSQIDQLNGRHLGSALAPHRNYTARTSAGMLPWQEIHADGWNTHFTAPHPVTGEFVTYEVWHAHDVATRYVPPFSIGLTETFEVIAKCVENTVRQGGLLTFLQTDSTRVVKNSKRFKTDPAVALADRVGFTIVHPQTVGNSQANGIAENFNTWLDRESRELATYQGKGMDSLTLKRVKKITARAVREQQKGNLDGYAAAMTEAERMGKGLVLRSHDEACDWLEDKRQKWNAQPHRSLPKIRDPETGKKRHMSPNESLAAALAEGWKPDLLAEEYLVHLFRPHVRVTVRREAVSPYGGMRYSASGLGDWNGKEVVVAYDIMDWRHVWVKTLDGELICVADFQEATGYRTQSAQEAADWKRAEARIKHRERQIDVIREQVGGAVLEMVPAESLPVFDLAGSISDAELAEMEARAPQGNALPDLLELAETLDEMAPSTEEQTPARAPAMRDYMDMALWLAEPDGADEDGSDDEIIGKKTAAG